MGFLHPFCLCHLHVCLSRRPQGELPTVADTKVCPAPCPCLMARAPLGQVFTCFVPVRPYHAGRAESASYHASLCPQLSATSSGAAGCPWHRALGTASVEKQSRGCEMAWP